jgi:hypothetical protein
MAWKELGTLTLTRDWANLPPVILPTGTDFTLLAQASLTHQTEDYALIKFTRIDDRYSSSPDLKILPTTDPQELTLTLPQEEALTWQWTPQARLVKRGKTYTPPWTLTLSLFWEQIQEYLY